jgi:hypothetical protein
MSKFDFIKNAATKVVDAAKAVDAVLIDPVQTKVTETVTEHRQIKAAKEVMRDQILAVGKSVLDSKEAEKARLAAEAADAKIAAELDAAGLLYTDAWAESVKNTFAA